MTEGMVKFMADVDALPAGDRVKLRRNAGKLLKRADASALMAFYRVLPREVGAYAEDRWFCAACLRCLWKPDEGMRATVAEAAGRYSSALQSAEGFEKRMVLLLDLDWNDDGFLAEKLCRLCRFLKQKDFVLKIDELLEDLVKWNYEDRPVQKKWAREYYDSRIHKDNQTEEGEG